MLSTVEPNKERILKFFEFIYDRHMMWYKRTILKEPHPWSNDPILNDYKSCNVYRELDKGTVYIIDELKDNKDWNNVLFNLVFYRFFNKYGFFENILDGTLADYKSFDLLYYEHLLDYRIIEKTSLFNSAYLVCQVPVNPDYRKSDKHIQVLFSLLDLRDRIQAGYIAKLYACETAYDTFAKIKELKLVGGFLAMQLYADLSYLKLISFTENDYVEIGPGAIDSLEFMFGNTKYSKQLDRCKDLRDMQPEMFEELYKTTGKNWKSIAYTGPTSNAPYLSLMNLQNSMCEWRKYRNLLQSSKDPTYRCKKRYYVVDPTRSAYESGSESI